MPLSERENFLRTASLTGGEWIPAHVVISGASWNQWREEMERVVLRHPTLFPGYQPGRIDFAQLAEAEHRRRNERVTDNWGCTWHAEIEGIIGIVEGHPLADWSALDTFVPPDPGIQTALGPIDWEATRRSLAEQRAAGRLAAGGLEHGFLFLRLTYLRGFEAFMADMAAADPHLPRLIELVTEFSWGLVSRYLEAGVDVMYFPDDLGDQRTSVMGPRMFRRWLAPAYRRLMQPCRAAGVHVHHHCDGYMLDIVDDLLDCGVSIINPQDLLNGIDAIAEAAKGRCCIDLDIDRQSIVPYGTPADIRALIEEGVRKLGSPQGGLMLVCGIYPPAPPENVDAVCSAIEEFRTYWFE